MGRHILIKPKSILLFLMLYFPNFSTDEVENFAHRFGFMVVQVRTRIMNVRRFRQKEEKKACIALSIDA